MNRISIVYTASNDLVDALSVSMISVLYNTENIVDFYILNVGINEPNRAIIRQTAESFKNFGEMKFVTVNLEQEFHEFPRFKGRFLDTYTRILIPEYFPDLNRCLYLDSDTLALGDVAELFDYGLDDFALGAVPDLWWVGLSDDKASLGNIKFSSGVLLIDCQKWRKEEITQRLKDIGLARRDTVGQSGLADMFILNTYFKSNQYKTLKGRYNFIGITTAAVLEIYGITKEDIETEARNCVIRHFSGTKPWISDHDQYYGTGRIRNFEDWWFFAAMSPFCEALKSKLLLNALNHNATQQIANTVQDSDIRLLARLFKRKYRKYKLLQFFTLGLVKKFRKRKEAYRNRYKQLVHDFI